MGRSLAARIRDRLDPNKNGVSKAFSSPQNFVAAVQNTAAAAASVVVEKAPVPIPTTIPPELFIRKTGNSTLDRRIEAFRIEKFEKSVNLENLKSTLAVADDVAVKISQPVVQVALAIPQALDPNQNGFISTLDPNQNGVSQAFSSPEAFGNAVKDLTDKAGKIVTENTPLPIPTTIPDEITNAVSSLNIDVLDKYVVPVMKATDLNNLGSTLDVAAKESKQLLADKGGLINDLIFPKPPIHIQLKSNIDLDKTLQTILLGVSIFVGAFTLTRIF